MSLLTVNRIRTLITLYSPEKGGRHTLPTGSGYAPHLSMSDGGYDVAVRFFETPNNIVFDNEYIQSIEIMYPDLRAAKELKLGRKFDILEGRRVIGNGVVSSET